MRRLRVYVDTSVFGGVVDEGFAEASRRFFNRVRNGEFVVLVSRVVLDELARAPVEVRRVLDGLPDGAVVQVPVDDEASDLAAAYIAGEILGEARKADAMHVAVATVMRADLILSWNFRHIVNYDLIRKFNGVNVLNGYPRIEIHSPWELSYGDESQDV